MKWPSQNFKPERPYKSFIEFITRTAWRCKWLERHPDKYPCLKCEGCGWVYDPNDPPCPIEGNKMRDRIKCDKCAGSGFGTRKACMAAYSASIADWKKRLAEWNEQQSLKKSALAKLTAGEREALGV